ncbi:MAG TPA: glycerol-3-phosphate 1-O-acyltransferase PlsB [Steroidobacteraceae bacterium]|jgi:glycerol-3-phosphate O-acyltransferase|nr:glycerol-3-phosphate 1-O-acyltransferase PlsB [Steroidobacteraceae bacterium]
MLLPWLRFTVRPQDVAAQLAAAPAEICYVLERDSTADELVLQRACTRAKLPRPGKRLIPGRGAGHRRSLLPLTRKVGVWRTRQDRRPPELLRELLIELRRDPEFDVTLVPVAVYWGRAPQREGFAWWRLALSEDWALASRLRRWLTLLLNGRNTLVQFGQGVSLRALLGADVSDSLASRRIARQLLAQLAAARAAHIGPDLSHRRTILTQVLRTRAVRAVVAQEVREKHITRRKALEGARAIFEEIAANYSHAFVSIMERVFTRLWTRIYDGVEFGHAGTLSEVAAGNEIVYVPCHRSHMDYMLLSYAIYRQGFAIPHIAAGINLNLPVVGRYLRKGGAFFIRRSFRGSALYTVVFMKYLAAIMARGHSIEYFIEGGRSRSGRLLSPKTGMLSMTIRSYLREPVRPVVFVPVYFGYERVMEGESYVSELSGKPKEKESFMGLLRALRKLRERFGRVHVNLGEPIHLTRVLDANDPDWRSRPPEDQGRASWVNAAVDQTAMAVMRNINAAAAVTPINLLAIVLLATPKHVMLEADLLRQLDFSLQLLRRQPYSDRVTLTPLDAAGIVRYGEHMLAVKRDGDAVGLDPAHAQLMAYYRNNVLHLFALPSLIACCFIANASMPTTDIQRLARRIYPYVAAELFLRWNEEEVDTIVILALQALAATGALVGSVEDGTWRSPPAATVQAMQLSLLAQPTILTIERYYLAIALLNKAGTGQITQSELENRTQQMANRMVTLYGFYSPDFFDRSLFESFIGLLRRRGVIRVDGEGKLAYDDVLSRIADDAQLVLSEALRHSILQVMHG